MIANREERHHDVRIILLSGGSWTASCMTCPWDFTDDDRIAVKVEGELHANPDRRADDGPWKSESQRRRERRERAARRQR